jgi:hypothetical protein
MTDSEAGGTDKAYKLEIDPRILELLGPNLYTNIYYVLAELIANAYDADARNVYIDAREAYIRVEDDGKGMSYSAGEVDNYLNVAGVSRTSEADSFTRSGRRKMGRKGVGKLAALSVSSEVEVMTMSKGEYSGFVLARTLGPDGLLRPIAESDIRFNHIQEHGSAIIMRQPQYQLHKTLLAVRRNLLKMFPQVSNDFRVHVSNASGSLILNAFDETVVGELSTLITLGDDFQHLAALVPNAYPEKRQDLVTTADEAHLAVTMKNSTGEVKTYTLAIRGWIGTYKSTRGRKAEITDFPDNFISLFANGKLGEFNVLPVLGQNKLSEVYIVGQLHVDLFELTELPDMALSNRQGYKSDDPRYVVAQEFIRDSLLSEVRRRRDLYVGLEKAAKRNRALDAQAAGEAELRTNVDTYRARVSDAAASAISALGSGVTEETLRQTIFESVNALSPDIGLKAKLDSQKKKILISQTRRDKPFADIIYSMLRHNGVDSSDIIYTASDDEVCRIPEGRSVYDYLREFFVESYSDQKIYVLFVTSRNTSKSWGAISEVGASWITQVQHKIFNVAPFRPEHPLDDDAQWQSTNRSDDGKELWMDNINADIMCVKIESVCDALGYSKRSRVENMSHLSSLVSIRED